MCGETENLTGLLNEQTCTTAHALRTAPPLLSNTCYIEAEICISFLINSW